MDLTKIAARVAAAPGPKPGPGPDELEALLEQAKAAGWKLAQGLLEISSIYWALILCKDTGPWEPYKGHRRALEPCDAYVLGWWFDDELDAMNNAGELIYGPLDPDIMEEGEEPAEQNVDPVVSLSPGEAADLVPEQHVAEVSARIRGVLDGTIEDRWEGAPRLDH